MYQSDGDNGASVLTILKRSSSLVIDGHRLWDRVEVQDTDSKEDFTTYSFSSLSSYITNV